MALFLIKSYQLITLLLLGDGPGPPAPDRGPGPPELPIDGWIWALLIVGLFYGIYILAKRHVLSDSHS